MKVADFFHTEPAKFSSTHGTGHMVTTAVIHFENKNVTTRTRLDVI